MGVNWEMRNRKAETEIREFEQKVAKEAEMA
jgi:hypothetical protein